MTDKKIISKSSFEELFKKLKQTGKRISAPKDNRKGQIVFGDVSSIQEVSLNHVQTTLSPKGVAFPRVEEILSFRIQGKDVQIDEAAYDTAPVVLFGIRPCDAKSLQTLNAVFTWDYDDTFFSSRLNNTIIIALSCNQADEYCFCTSVGGHPGDTTGSDILLTDLGNSEYLAEIITDKGRMIVSLVPDLFKDGNSVNKEKYLAEVKSHFNITPLAENLDKVFDSGIFKEQSLRCVGCGTCAFVCPSCSCFDIQDETLGSLGKRYRCWDSCAFSLFTLHTSGHNPREVQSQRWRQRLMHKFVYQPKRLSVLGCVGCGRCSRACPADMNILEHLQEIAEVK